MGRLGPQELIIILFIVVLLFGAKKLPDLARSLGQSIKEFNKAKDEGLRSMAEADAKPKEEKKENEQSKS
jgi:sec-independent protein translocase protein TatA